MKIEGSYRGLKGSQQTVYDFMMDPEILAKSIPVFSVFIKCHVVLRPVPVNNPHFFY